MVADQKLVAISDFSFLFKKQIFHLLDLSKKQFLLKVKSLVHFVCFPSKACFLTVFHENFQKDLSQHEVSKNFKM